MPSCVRRDNLEMLCERFKHLAIGSGIEPVGMGKQEPRRSGLGPDQRAECPVGKINCDAFHVDRETRAPRSPGPPAAVAARCRSCYRSPNFNPATGVNR